MAPFSGRLFNSRSGGGAGPPGPAGPAGPAGPPGSPAPGITFSDHGVPLAGGPVTSIDIEGIGGNAFATGPGAIQINVPPAAAPAFGFAYFSGGMVGGVAPAVNNTDRLTFASDVVAMVSKGILNTAILGAAGFNSATFGYVAGGENNALATVALIQRLNFASDATGMVLPGSTLTSVRKNPSAANSTTFGYIAGGENGVPADTSSCDGMAFASDNLICVAKGALTAVRTQQAATNSNLAGYFSGGLQGALAEANTSALIFASDATAMVAKGVLGSATNFQVAFNSTTFGYYTGGTTLGVPTVNTWRLDFSSDASAMVAKGALSTVRTNAPGGANSTLAGYAAGGNTTGALGFTNICDTLLFSTDAAAMLAVGSLTVPRDQLAGYQSGGIL